MRRRISCPKRFHQRILQVAKEMVTDILNVKWKGTASENLFKKADGTAPYPLDAAGNLVFQSASGRKWEQRNDLLPLATQQLQLNPKLEQNPG